MFKIFKRRKDKPALTYGMMQRFGEAVEKRQRKLALYLNRKTNSYSKRKWALFLCGFCLLFGGMASLILYQSMTSEKLQSADKLYPQSIAIPSSVLQQGKMWDSLQLLEEIYRHRKDSIFHQQNNKH